MNNNTHPIKKDLPCKNSDLYQNAFCSSNSITNNNTLLQDVLKL